MMVRAADLPSELKDAFLDALEAWTLVEDELFIWYQLMGSSDLEREWAAFQERRSLEGQISATQERIERSGIDSAAEAHLIKLLQRVRRKAGSRNRLVHGHWSYSTVRPGDEREYYRRYEPRDRGQARPAMENERNRLLGRVLFYGPEMRLAERTFRALARDLMQSKRLLFKAALANSRVS